MSEERARVLRLLEEGKVTADQAARLIEALGPARTGDWPSEPPIPPRPPRGPKMMHFRMAELDRIPDIVASAVSSAMKSGFGTGEGDAKTEFPGKSSLYVKNVSGDVTVEGWDEDRIELESEPGMTRIREREDIVMVRAISGDFRVHMPREVRLELTSVSGDTRVSGVGGRFGLKSVSGDVTLSGFSGEVSLQVVSGDVKLDGITGKVEVESKSGDITLAPAGAVEGALASKSGDINIRLAADADVVLDLETEDGLIHSGVIEFDARLEHKVLEQGEHRLRVQLGAGSRELKARTRAADIVVRRAGKE